MAQAWAYGPIRCSALCGALCERCGPGCGWLVQQVDRTLEISSPARRVSRYCVQNSHGPQNFHASPAQRAVTTSNRPRTWIFMVVWALQQHTACEDPRAWRVARDNRSRYSTGIDKLIAVDRISQTRYDLCLGSACRTRVLRRPRNGVLHSSTLCRIFLDEFRIPVPLKATFSHNLQGQHYFFPFPPLGSHGDCSNPLPPCKPPGRADHDEAWWRDGSIFGIARLTRYCCSLQLGAFCMVLILGRRLAVPAQYGLAKKKR